LHSQKLSIILLLILFHVIPVSKVFWEIWAASNLSKIEEMENFAESISRDPVIFRHVFEAYHYPLYKFLLKKIGSDFLAKEIAQLTFIKLWKNRTRIPTHIDIKIQILQIAKTTLIDEIRKMEARRKLYLKVPEKSAVWEEAYKEAQQRLLKILNLLPPKRREVFELSRFQAYSNIEIAEKLAISPKTVENHITLAIRFARTFFKSNER
jgi:RNA polymerase sigma factor (sigma-70 family)